MPRKQENRELRIVGGEYRGRKIQAVPGQGTRPLLAQVREAIFNILGVQLHEAQVWDLFAGTGASGIEALSRGARHVSFVERSRKALAVLRENLSFLEANDAGLLPYTLLRGDAWHSESWLMGNDLEPDLIFFDPPYADVVADPSRALKVLAAIARHLRPSGSMIFHFPKDCFHPEDFEEFSGVDLRTWGSSAVAFLRAP